MTYYEWIYLPTLLFLRSFLFAAGSYDVTVALDDPTAPATAPYCLSAAIKAANEDPGSTINITVSPITLSGGYIYPILNAMTIQSMSGTTTINGGSTCSGFYVYSSSGTSMTPGTVHLIDLLLTNMQFTGAAGGNGSVSNDPPGVQGGGGGGGVANSPRSTGAGGAGASIAALGITGGAGGAGGDSTVFSGGGGGGSDGTVGGDASASPSSGAGGGNGGGGGGTLNIESVGGAGGTLGGGGGGGGNEDFLTTSPSGGAGGFGAGGGGGGSTRPSGSTIPVIGTGGTGGLGGGGGGGGAYPIQPAMSSAPPFPGGTSLFGGGTGGNGQMTANNPGAGENGGGGGGAALGGAIFIAPATTVTISSGGFSTNTVTGGAGGAGGAIGSSPPPVQNGASGGGYGVDIFLVPTGNLTFDLSSDLTLSNAIQSNSGTKGILTVSGTNKLTYSDDVTSTNLYVADVTLSGGIFNIKADTGLGDLGNNLILNGGTLQAQQSFTINSGRTLSTNFSTTSTLDALANTLTIPNGIGGTGNIVINQVTSTGTVTFSGLNGYTGSTAIAHGTLALSGSGRISSSSSVTDNGTLDISATTSGATINTLSGSGGIALGSKALTVIQGSTGTLSGDITGAGSLTKQGAGTLILTGTNDYSGGTTVSTGILQGNTTSLQGDILDNANVTFDQSTTGTYAGSMSGSGSLTKTNAGTLILTGTNVYSGGTTVSAGSLQGNTTSLQGDILDNANVTFDQSTTGTYAGSMSGSGSLTKTNAGTLTLTGTNSYSGGTTVSAGSLQGNTTTLQGDILDNANVTFDQSTTGTYAGSMSGSGSLTKINAGTLTLTGTNSYSGGTTVSTGILQGNTTSLQGDIINNANVTFNQSTTGTYAGSMSGSGSLTKTNAGTLTLTGTNSYSGGTIVSAGSLQGNTASLQGDILDNADVTFNETGSATFSGFIHGSGTVHNIGSGIVTFGTANTYTGLTSITGGKLVVNASLVSDVTIALGGTLGGTGPVGDVINSGRVEPGNSIGTLVVASYQQDSGGILQVEGDALGNSDRIQAAGAVDVLGTLELVTLPGTYTADQIIYTIITSASMGVNIADHFSSVSIISPLIFTTDVLYSNAEILLVLTFRGSTFALTGLKGNAAAAAACFMEIDGGLSRRVSHPGSDLDQVIVALTGQSPAFQQAAFNQIQPSQDTAFTLAQEENGVLLREAITRQIWQPCSKGWKKEGAHFWADTVGQFNWFSAQQEQRHFKNITSGNVIGFELTREFFSLGIAGGYSYSMLRWGGDIPDPSHINSYYGIIYSNFSGIYWDLEFIFIGAQNEYRAIRNIEFGDLFRKVKYRADGYEGLAHLNVSASSGEGKLFTPFARLDYIYTHRDSFQEGEAGVLNVAVNSKNYQRIRSEVGVEWPNCNIMRNASFSPKIKLGYVYETPLNSSSIKAHFVGQTCQFEVEGWNPTYNLFAPSVGLNWSFQERRLSLNLQYDAEIGSKYFSQQGSLHFDVRF